MSYEILIPAIIKAFGGLGLFLLGMVIMTEGLRSLTGDMIKNALMRFTRSPYSGALTGAVSTALLQSSSATTVMAVGFVGAGLMSFPQALGIIFGANIGSTATGWLVALFGFKFSLSSAAMPLIFLGVIGKLFFKGKAASFGYAIAGFGLIFVGIASLQEGMGHFEGIINPEHLPSDSWIGSIKLVLVGIAATLITQASSAGVAATLTALYLHTINFEQAAALVIGMDVGTTVTAALASIGGSARVRQTGLSHVVYNCFTAIMALCLITPYVFFLETINPSFLDAHAEIALVAFHTFFNTLGVLLILPFAKQFAALMGKIIKSEEPPFTRRLDKQLLKEPSLALEVARISIEREFVALLEHINFILGDFTCGKRADLISLQLSLDETQDYVDSIKIQPKEIHEWQRMVFLAHLLDHLQRLHERCDEDAKRAHYAASSMNLQEERNAFCAKNEKIIEAITSKNFSLATKYAKESNEAINNAIEPFREFIAAKIAEDKISIPEGNQHREAIKWLLRVSTHIWRIAYYLERTVMEMAN